MRVGSVAESIARGESCSSSMERSPRQRLCECERHDELGAMWQEPSRLSHCYRRRGVRIDRAYPLGLAQPRVLMVARMMSRGRGRERRRRRMAWRLCGGCHGAAAAVASLRR